MRLLAIIGLVSATTAVALPLGHVLHEKRAAAPRMWIKRNAVDRTRLLPMRIGLKQNNLDRVRNPARCLYTVSLTMSKGHEMLMDVYVYSRQGG